MSAFRVTANLHEVAVVVLGADGDATLADVIREYARDLAQRLLDGWTLLTMSMYPVRHRAGGGYPGMNLD